MNQALLIPIIEASGVIIASIITGACLLLSAKAVFSKKQLRRKLVIALSDLAFFQAVEEIHVQMEIGREKPNNKVKVRKIAQAELEFTHSGRSLGEVKKQLQQLHLIDE